MLRKAGSTGIFFLPMAKEVSLSTAFLEEGACGLKKASPRNKTSWYSLRRSYMPIQFSNALLTTTCMWMPGMLETYLDLSCVFTPISGICLR